MIPPRQGPPRRRRRSTCSATTTSPTPTGPYYYIICYHVIHHSSLCCLYYIIPDDIILYYITLIMIIVIIMIIIIIVIMIIMYVYIYIYSMLYHMIGPRRPARSCGSWRTRPTTRHSDPGTLKSDIVSKKHPQLICSNLRLKLKIRRLKLWKPTVITEIRDRNGSNSRISTPKLPPTLLTIGTVCISSCLLGVCFTHVSVCVLKANDTCIHPKSWLERKRFTGRRVAQLSGYQINEYREMKQKQ